MTKLQLGKAVPTFALTDQDGDTARLEDFAGSKLLIYFYPKALTPGCTTQSRAVSAAKDEFAGLNCKVVGISPDEPGKQKKFDDKHQLGFPLLSDPDHAVAEAFGVWGEKKMYGKTYMGIIRSAFLVDEDGKLIEAWHKVSPKATAPNVMDALKP